MLVLGRWSWGIIDSIQVMFLLSPYVQLLEQAGFGTVVLKIPSKHSGIGELGLVEMLLEGHRTAGSWFGGADRICLLSGEQREVSSCRSLPLGANNLSVAISLFE